MFPDVPMWSALRSDCFTQYLTGRILKPHFRTIIFIAQLNNHPHFMDPDPATGGYPGTQTEAVTSQFLKTTFMTVVFSACHGFKTETNTPSISIHASPPDTVAVQPAKADAPKKKKKTIYLTFDDGPNKGTRNMYDVIKKEEVPVTLFIIGEHVYGSKDQAAIFDSLVNCRYIEIANHSFTHAFKNKFLKFYQVPDSALKDFKRCADSLQLTSNIIRTPGRNIWRTSTVNSTDIKASSPAADTLYANGFLVVGWDLEWHYDKSLNLLTTGEQIIQQIDSMFSNSKTKTPGHLVLLAHDQVYEDSSDSTQLSQFIVRLKAKDEYDFETVSRYPGLKN